MDYKRIIESAYDRTAWQTLLHDIFGDKARFYDPPRPLPPDKALLAQAWLLGLIELDDGQKIGVYEAELKHVDLARNRVGVRNLLSPEWRNRGFVGAFQFCYTQGSSELRFSYASETWGFDEKDNFRRKSTDTHRYTYLLGAGHRSRTACDQFKKLKASDLTLRDVTEAFSVEAVSKRFFDEYKQNYESIVEFVTGKRMVKAGGKWQEKETGKGCREILAAFAPFANPEKAVRDYVKKLMGRLVFLQFLQKKGWLGVPRGRTWNDGDREFLRHLFDRFCRAPSKADATASFVDSVLEPLFDDINTRRPGDLANPVLGSDVLVPYLNGGLFERDAADDVAFPLPTALLKRLFDFFDAYNFTIDENDPEDAEVGVDPEMLSRIFENLLEDNKDKGAFYTPKSIVEYMCRESLAAYLQTDLPEADKPSVAAFVRTHEAAGLASALRDDVLKRLREVKICDPAIGSGAFPMGLLKELVACRKALGDPLAETDPAALKREIIENNIYGVDIEKGAVDIARLRFWLALVVDEESPHTLPNLDFKIMQGNSLVESFGGVALDRFRDDDRAEDYKSGKKKGQKRASYYQAEMVFDERDAMNEIVRDKNALFSETRHEQKAALIERINRNVKAFISHKLDRSSPWQTKIPEGQNDKFFLWHVWFADVFSRPGKSGFDIVIANPPYIKEYENRKAFDGFREQSPYYIGKMDLWYGFACHGIDILKQGGILCFIAQNNWTTSAGARKMREKVIADTRILQLVDFNDHIVFNSAQIQTMIMTFAKDHSGKEFVIEHRSLKEGAVEADVEAMLRNQPAGNVFYRNPTLSREDDVSHSLPLFGETGLIKKMEGKSNFAVLESEIVQGIIGNPDDAFKIRDSELGELSESEMKFVHRFYTHTDRYVTVPGDENVIYISNKSTPSFVPERYPGIQNRILPYKAKLLHRREVENGRLQWYFMHWPRVEKVFKAGAKIVWAARTEGRNFTYTDSEFYGSRNLFYLETDRINLKCLVGIYNSRLMLYFMENRLKHLGALLQLDKNQIAKIPLVKPDDAVQCEVAQKVDAIIAAKRGDPSADTSALEAEIDEKVYDLYGLTPVEREIVEKAVTR